MQIIQIRFILVLKDPDHEAGIDDLSEVLARFRMLIIPHLSLFGVAIL